MIGKKLEIFKKNDLGNKLVNTDVINLLAKRGCGKTTIIWNYIKENQHRVKNVLYFSPNLDCDETTQEAMKKVKVNIIFTDNVSELEAFVTMVTETAKNAQREGKKKDFNIVVIDDSSGDSNIFPANNNKTPLTRAVIASRHINTSFILALHRYNSIPTLIREAVNYTYYFKSNNKTNKLVAEEVKIDHNVFEYLVNTYLNHLRDFLLIDQDNEKVYLNGIKLIYEKSS